MKLLLLIILVCYVPILSAQEYIQFVASDTPRFLRPALFPTDLQIGTWLFLLTEMIYFIQFNGTLDCIR